MHYETVPNTKSYCRGTGVLHIHHCLVYGHSAFFQGGINAALGVCTMQIVYLIVSS